MIPVPQLNFLARQGSIRNGARTIPEFGTWGSLFYCSILDPGGF